MGSASIQFVVFGLAAAVLANLGHARWWRSSVLLLASIAFLYLLEPDPLTYLPLAGFLLLAYFACWVVQHKSPRLVGWSVLILVLVYIWLKKYTFLPQASFLRFPYFTLGLSYIFFRVLHLVIESGEGKDKPRLTPLSYLLYTLNFTTLLSGPIQRYADFIRDQHAIEPPPLGIRVAGLQLERIIRGFFKVNVLAILLDGSRQDALLQLTHPYAPMPMRYLAALKLSVVYPFFLYCNFSGYIDIVIALARLMRLRLPENFDRPFSASSFLDFWNRWHITLSNWLKTYVFNPLLIAFMRRIASPGLQSASAIFCFFVTFFLIGLWHGRTAEFIFFGLLLGAGVAVNKTWQVALTALLGRKRYNSLSSNPIYVAFGRGLTFSWFAFTLYWFWSSWSQIHSISSAIGLLPWLGVWSFIWLTATMVLAAWEILRALLLAPKVASGPLLLTRYARVVYATALGFVAVVMVLLLNQPAPEIVYKAF